jgi:hypothetical protein
MLFGIPDTRQFPWDQALSYNLQQLTNKVTGGINTWAVNPTVGVDGLALGANHEGYTGVNTTTNTLVRWSGSDWVMVMDSPKLVYKPKLSLYVSQNTGSDSNDGLTSGTAWKTISKLYQELMTYNFLEKQVDIYLGAGTYILRFPSLIGSSPIRVFGVSSSSVTIQRLDVAYGQNVSVQGVTFALPVFADNLYFHWTVLVSNSSLFSVGPDVVFGPIGNFVAGRNTAHIVAMSASSVFFYANSPVTIKGSVNSFCSVSAASSIIMHSFAGGPTTSTLTAPQINNGAVYDSLYSSLVTGDTTTTFNCIGNLSIATFFGLANSRMNPGRSVITGNVVGVPYVLTDGAYINTGVYRGTPVGNGLGVPDSMSVGSADATSRVYGPTL